MKDSRNALLREQESGSLLTELAIIFPLIFLIAAAGLSFGKALKTLEIATAISREGANIAFRDCTLYPDPASTTQSCLDKTRDRMKSLAESLGGSAEDVEVLVSIFESDGASLPSRKAISPATGIGDKPSYRTRFAPDGSATAGGTNSLDLDTAKQHRVVVISEVYLPNAQFFPSLLVGEPSQVYDATVF